VNICVVFRDDGLQSLCECVCVRERERERERENGSKMLMETLSRLHGMSESFLVKQVLHGIKTQ
jgi:hypothetical protein